MKNKKEERRKKFRTLILLLFLTIIMFGTSTYAWFTANQLVTINSLNVHVESTGGIQISTNASSWKSVITTTDINAGYHYDLGNNTYLNAVNQVPADLTAVSTDCVPNTTGDYVGKLNMYAPTIATDAGGAYTLATTIDREVGGTDGAANTTTGKFIVFDIFLRLDAQRTVYLTADSDVVLKEGETEERGLKNSARAAFVYLGNMISSTEPATLAGMNSPLSSNGVILWEPNYDTHTATVVTSVAPEYGVTLTSDGGTGTYQAVPYRGVNQAISPAQSLIGTVNASHPTLGTQNGTTALTPNIQTKAGNGTLNVFKANMPAGVSKYRVYLWIEGQDIDCENGATGSNITFNIKLTTTGPASSSNGG